VIYTVKTGTYLDSTYPPNGRKLARKSNGDLWCTYRRSDGTYDQIYCSYSTDGGETWTEEQVTSATDNQYSASIAIDSNDYVHIVFDGYSWGSNPTVRNIQYRKRTTEWQAQEAVTDINYSQYHPAIAIDSNDYVHVAWAGTGTGLNPLYRNIQYRKRTTTWGAQESLSDVHAHNYEPAIAIDSDDNVHVVWTGAGWGTYTGYNNVQYRKRTTGWQAQEAITDINAHQYFSGIAIDSNDYIHIIWEGAGWGIYTANDNVQYRKRTSAWETQEGVTDKGAQQYEPSIAIDSNDYVHVAWDGKGWGTNSDYYNIQYRRRTTTWQTQESITDRAYNNEYANLIWARYPVIDSRKTNQPQAGCEIVWSGQDVSGYKVEFYKSDDISWGAAGGGGSRGGGLSCVDACYIIIRKGYNPAFKY